MRLALRIALLLGVWRAARVLAVVTVLALYGAGAILAASTLAAATNTRTAPDGMLWQGDLDHFEAFCKTLTLDNGRKFVLEDFQRVILRDFFGGAKETLVLIPKKNGKTTLMAALVVYHLCFIDEARGYVAAASRDQATLLYDQAKGFVNRSPALQRRILVRGGTRELRSRRDDGFVRVLAADSDTADGVMPTLAIVDELHRHKSTALYDVFRDGLDARDGSMLTISTAGDDEDGPLGRMRSAYLALSGIRTKGRYTYARSADGSAVMHEWSLKPTDDLDDLDLVKAVNPLKSMTKAKLKRRRDSPSMTRHAWSRFACNVWAQDDSAAIAALDWLKVEVEGVQIPDGAGLRKVIGIDLGWTVDSSALIPVGYLDATLSKVAIDNRLRIVPAPGDGTMLDEEVLKTILRAWGHHETGLWPDAEFALDPNAGGQSLAQWIVRELCAGNTDRVVAVSQQPASMQEASMHFSSGLRSKTVEEGDAEEGTPRTVPIRHPGHPDLNRHSRAAVARYNGERWRFDKRRVSSGSTKVRPKPIDGIIGATLGYRALMAPQEAAPEPFVLVAS